MGKLGFFIPRTLSTALSSQRDEGEPESFHVQENSEDITENEQRLRRRPGWSRNAGNLLPQSVVRIGRSIIKTGEISVNHSRATSQARGPISLSAIDPAPRRENAPQILDHMHNVAASEVSRRNIRFPDEASHIQDGNHGST